MTTDERARLNRQRRIARTPPLVIERHEPLDGQGDLYIPPCHACGAPIIRHRGRWACPKCAGIEEGR